MRFEFDWSVSDPEPDGTVYVRERLIGSDLLKIYGPMPQRVVDSFVKARRQFVDRTIRTKTDAVKIFEPQPQPPHKGILQ